MSVWHPENIEDLRLYQWMKQLGFESYDDFYQASINDIEWLANELPQALHLVWEKPYDAAVDLINGSF